MITYTFATSMRSSSGAINLNGSDNEAGNSEWTLDETFSANVTSQSVSSSVSISYATLQGIYVLADQNCTVVAGINAVQTVTTTGSPTGGTFTLTYGGQTTSALNYNATAAQVQAALQALSSIGTTQCTAAGGPLPTGITVTFTGTLGLQPITLMTHTDSLTGGSSPAVSIATTTTGVTAATWSLKAGNPLVWGASPGYFSNPLTANVTGINITTTSATRLRMRALNN